MRIDSWIERIKEQHADCERREQRLHVLEKKHADTEGDDDQCDRSGIEPVEWRIDGWFGMHARVRQFV